MSLIQCICRSIPRCSTDQTSSRAGRSGEGVTASPCNTMLTAVSSSSSDISDISDVSEIAKFSALCTHANQVGAVAAVDTVGSESDVCSKDSGPVEDAASSTPTDGLESPRRSHIVPVSMGANWGHTPTWAIAREHA